MLGAIGTRDVLMHPVVTIRSFGWRVFFRAAISSRQQTFLSLLQQADCFQASPPQPSQLIDRCIRLERDAMHLYDTLAHRFSQTPALEIFFAHLSEQERKHAEMLEICRAALCSTHCNEGRFRRWQDDLPMLEQQMHEYRQSLAEATSPEDALRLVLRIESSEINRAFDSIVKATRSPFVSRLGAFRKATRRHIAFICTCIPDLAPALKAECRDLRVRLLP